MQIFSLTLSSVVLLTTVAIAQPVPPNLKPPEGATPAGAYTAKGLQIYVCAAHGTTNEWVFEGPEAELSDAKGAVFAKHYAGPTWEATDGSKVAGKLMTTVPAPTAGDIPWLLLSAESSGQGALTGVRFIQRLKTDGGVGPTGACPMPGEEKRVPYSAEYDFYK